MKLFDAHCDTLTTAYRNGDALLHNRCHIDLQRLSKYESAGQIFAIWVDDRRDARYGPDEMACYTEHILCFWQEQLHKNQTTLQFCTTAKELQEDNDKIKAVLALEGGCALGGSMKRLEKYYEAGIRVLTLTWNAENELGFGAMTGSNEGLKPFGKEVLRFMRHNHMLADVSHLNEAGFWDVLNSGCRVVATHSNAAAICPHPRNLTDAQYLALCAAGGGTGLNLYPEFVGGKADMDAVMRHVEHFLTLAGPEHLFLGSDLDGIDLIAADMTGVEDMPVLYDALWKYTKNQQQVDQIFYTNLYQILIKTLPN